MDKTLEAAVTIAGLIAAIAIIALIVSPKAKTSSVIQSVASGYANNIAVAIAPVTGAVPQANLSYPDSGFGTFGNASGQLGAPTLLS